MELARVGVVRELNLAALLPPRKECIACPRLLGPRQRTWCSEYCRQWARKHPGERQQTERPIKGKKVPYSGSPGECQAGCGRPTSPRKYGEEALKWCSNSCRTWAQSHPGMRRADARLSSAEFEQMNRAYEALNGDRNANLRERLGRQVRDTWIAWALEQPDPKPSWLTTWDKLSPELREVDCRIGLTLYRMGRREIDASIDESP